MILYDELLKRYNALVKENNDLKNELNRLKLQLGISESTDESALDNKISINKYSSPREKIALFRSLFKGREDVFARRWYSKNLDKSGYQPVCENEWTKGKCDKRKNKCSICPNRKLASLADKDIYKHLEGKDVRCRDVIGIYPMLLDETCHFICADFDDENYEKDVLAFREVCDKYKIPVSIERSRSGKGAHAWIFFETPVSAGTARELGSGILTKAMERRSELSFSSYDRLFPNQDTMPDGGFGNLIALPLQGQARKSNNSVFVDKNFIPYADQWSYLGQVEKLSVSEVEELVAEFRKSSILGTLLEDKTANPWEIKKKIALTIDDFPETVQIIHSNMLYIPKNGLSSAAQNRIKRLAAFKNPDFYKSQAMRLSVYNKPRVICTAEISDSYIGIPRGCDEELFDIMDSLSVSYELLDKTNGGRKISVSFNGSLRDEQKPAAKELLKYPNGVLSATTAFGKTVIAAYIIGQRKINTLILVHTQALMRQWKKALEEFLVFDISEPNKTKGHVRKKIWSPVGVLGAGQNTLGDMVDIAVMQSLSEDDDVKECVRNYGMVIVDECHHVSAVNFEKILKYANAKYVYGLTATPTRRDGHHPIIFMQCGPIRYRVDAKKQAENRPFEHYLIPRFTAFRYLQTEKSITSLYGKLLEDTERNKLIIDDVIEAVKIGRTPIILTERREHVAILAEILENQCDNVIQLVGTASAKKRREIFEQLDNIPTTESLVIIATGKYVGEGFDYSRLDTLFLALPIAWKGKVAQYAGRLHRNYGGKTEVQIYDYVDIHVPVLEKMYQKRIKGYSSIGYKTKSMAEEKISPNLIYDGKEFYSVFAADVLNAKKDILIVSPVMRKNRVMQMIKTLSPVILNNVSVIVVTRPSEDFDDKDRNIIKICAEYLQQYNIKVIYRSNFHQKFTIIDQSIVWYGNVNFLCFGSTEECIMRFENHEIAMQLMDTIEDRRIDAQ